MRIALDAMGGDNAPSSIIEGALLAVNEYRDLEVALVGDEAVIRKELAGKKYPEARILVRHAPEVIGMHEPALAAIRKKKNSSIRKSIDMVRAGEAQAVVSAGHSGVAMALSLLLLGMAESVERPAIAAIMPTLKKPFILIDAGANVDSSPVNLFQFALMGDAYARHIFGRAEPKVGILSIGEESTKGNELTKESFKLIETSGLNFIGNIEGKDVFLGEADVVVCDGFIGNVVLKTSEGLAEVIIKMLKREIGSLILGKLGYIFIKGAVRAFKKKTDYAEYGGAPLLGINGTCIISHGRSNGMAIKNALKVAQEFARKDLNHLISQQIESRAAKGNTLAAG
jgi:glycerol-3-phosphate acyltransferase PlsX